MAEGNERRRFHGTRRECSVGNNGSTKLCSSPTCSLCCIMKRGFDLNKAGSATGFSRFGQGIYTSATSSKANSYSTNSTMTPFKAVLLNKVVVGKGKKLYFGDSSLDGAPPGYDSILGEPAKNGRGELNYDELVVYDQRAIIPSFLIVYKE
ncbi:ADP-ribosylation [Serendipita vermifera]|nr:ADP-ribosylation [Serendipita vermifera]